MRQNRLFLWSSIGLILIILSLACAGCGKKNDPMPPRVTLPTVADLVAHSSGEGIVLGWSVPDPPAGIAGFKIFRSETRDGSRACPGCPQEHRPYGTVALADDRLKREGETGFRYVDADVEAGGFYSYRIAGCNRAGSCGMASNESGTIHTGR